ncbi:MAG: lactate permease [Candidatus Bathyarchaeota archaeon B24]|nr:MAG: lactate permease [Candidatus Bathyarchaeota archaeon B24]
MLAMVMWLQPIDPFGFLTFSVLAAAAPISALIVSLCVLRLTSHRSAALASIVAFAVALLIYQAPPEVVVLSYLYGAVFGLWPIAWIVVNAMFLYNVSKETGSIEAFRSWVEDNLPGDKALVALFTAFLFGGLIEGIDGYGFPIAISSALLTHLGLTPLQAVAVSLIANTIPVPFASLGVPVETLRVVSGLGLKGICIPLSLQLAVFSVVISLSIIHMISGFKGLRRFFDVATVAGLSMGLFIYVTSVHVDPHLAGVVSPMASIPLTIAYMRARGMKPKTAVDLGAALRGWLPWLLAVAFMAVFGLTGGYKLISVRMPINGLDGEVYISLYGRPYQAVYEWQLLAHGTLALLSALTVASIYRLKPGRVARIYLATWSQMRYAVLTILQVVGLAFLMNYAGLSFTLGYVLSTTGRFFPMLSGFIGWLGTFVSGSETGSNALFGNLQRVSAELLGLPPYVIVSLNCTGGVFGKIVCLQSISIGVSAVKLVGREGEIMRRLLPYSLVLTASLGLIAYLQIALA